MKENPLNALVQRFGQNKLIAQLFSKTAHHLDRPILRRTNGRTSLSSLLTGLPIVSLTTTGRKSGLARTVPLVGLPDGEKIILIASNFGGQRNPAWYYNLKANPEAVLVINGRSAVYIASEATGEEREKYWQQAVNTYLGFRNYETWANHRDIPVMVLRPMRTKNEEASS